MSADGTLTLYGNRHSGHSYKVRLALAVAGVEHRYVHIDIDVPHAERPEPFRRLAPFGEVPLLTHERGDDAPPRVMAQSDAILCWLAERTGRFGGESPERMQQVRTWLFWEANRLGLSLPHLRFARRFAPQDYPAGAVDWLAARYARDIARLNEELARHSTGFVIDELPTVADFALCGYLFWASQAGVDVPPHVQAWLDRIARLPGWQHPDELLRA